VKCPYCGQPDSRVTNSRPSPAGDSIRRRRECEKCERRFNTFEVVERSPSCVQKRNGVLERYDSEKLRAGILRACEKRPVTAEHIDRIVLEVENEAFSGGLREASTDAIGKLVLRALKDVDQVAYLRFASVYKQFRDLQDFDSEIQSLLKG